MLQRLPLDLSTFRKLRDSDYLYVDKTSYAYELIKGGRRYFLSRPRRFGKSLFVSTLKEIFLGNKDLFKDLYIGESDYQWQSYGVISLDLSSFGIYDAESMKQGLCYALAAIAKDYDLGISIDTNIPELALHAVVKEMQKKFGRVAVLIDEYDYPILQVIKNHSLAEIIRDAIRRFFAAIKGLDADIDFVFITGVSSFAKAGVFSGMNNLRTITLDARYAGICGYTDYDIDVYFSSYIRQWAIQDNIPIDTLKSKIKYCYNGYHFGKRVDSVYNPFSFMKALEEKEFKNFWFQSGTPTFLVEILKRDYLSFDPDKLEVSEDSLGIIDVGNTPLMALMFQTGYLTIVGFDKDNSLYKLDYPNFEVKTSFQKYLLEAFANIDSLTAERISRKFRFAVNNLDINEAVTLLEQLFSKVPYLIHIPKEKYYQSLLIMVCASSGIKTHAEYLTSHGRIDLVMELNDKLYIVEAKFNKPASEALEQIKDREYFKPFFDYNKHIFLLGLSFNKSSKDFKIGFDFLRLK